MCRSRMSNTVAISGCADLTWKTLAICGCADLTCQTLAIRGCADLTCQTLAICGRAYLTCQTLVFFVTFSNLLAISWQVKKAQTAKMSESCLTPTFQLYHGENNLISMKWGWGPLCIRPACLAGFFYSASSLKQQSADIHIAPLGHITLFPSQPVFSFSLKLQLKWNDQLRSSPETNTRGR